MVIRKLGVKLRKSILLKKRKNTKRRKKNKNNQGNKWKKEKRGYALKMIFNLV